MTLGEKITHLRKKRGLSQEELAITLNVSRQAVSKWETGEAKPDTDKVVALAEYFEVTTDWLLRDIAPLETHTGTDAHMSPAQARAGAPLLLCLTLGASACGLFLLFYGRFVSASDIPSVIGLILQICAIAMAMGFGLYLKNGIDAAQGSGFIRAFWRVDIWMVALLPLRMLYFTFMRLLSLIPESTLSRLWTSLPQPFWELGRVLLFAGVPIALYLAVCLFVTLVLCRRPRQRG
nr:helix-turn-helix transcriptional regulator [uncultured Agathobaculum sp.]